MLDFCIVGCGRIAKRHSELLGNGIIPGAKLTAVCDLVPEKAEKIGKQFGVPWYTDMHKMMQEIKPAVVTILTESGNHARDTIALSQYGAHIVVEKPIGPVTSNTPANEAGPGERLRRRNRDCASDHTLIK